MIIVEIVTNSIKYAFPDNVAGTIHVNIHKIDSGIMIDINDNGIGIKSDFNLDNTKSVGLHLVGLLVQQLGGNMSITSDNGTKIKILIDGLLL